MKRRPAALHVSRAAVQSTTSLCISEEEGALRKRLELLLAHCELGNPTGDDDATQLVVRMLAALGGDKAPDLAPLLAALGKGGARVE